MSRTLLQCITEAGGDPHRTRSTRRPHKTGTTLKSTARDSDAAQCDSPPVIGNGRRWEMLPSPLPRGPQARTRVGHTVRIETEVWR